MATMPKITITFNDGTPDLILDKNDNRIVMASAVPPTFPHGRLLVYQGLNPGTYDVDKVASVVYTHWHA